MLAMTHKYQLRVELLYILSILSFVPPNFCGNRIINGVPRTLDDFPFQVLIQFYRKERERRTVDPTCGGSILEANWIMTAGHCFNEDLPEKISVIAGFEDPDRRTERPVKAQKYFTHPKLKFRNMSVQNDIALIKLQMPLKFNAKINKTALPEKQIEKVHGSVYVTGWGVTKEGLTTANSKLLGAKIKIQKEEACAKVYGSSYDPKTMICAGVRSGHKDSCAGDSGGPLTKVIKINPVRDRKVVIGIISYGNGCGRKDTYALYTRVLAFIDWIKETINNN